MLCPSELVKVNALENYILHYISSHNHILYSSFGCDTKLIQCRMQVQGTDTLVPKSGRYTGPLDCACKTIKDEGVSKSFASGRLNTYVFS